MNAPYWQKRLWPRRLAFGLLLATLCGCSSSSLIPSPKSDEIEELKRQNVELQKQATVGRIEVARLQREVARLEAELEATRRPPQSAPTVQPASPEPEPITSPPVADQPEIEVIDLEEEPLSEPPTPSAAPVATEASATDEGRQSSPRLPSASTMPSAEAQRLYDEGYTLFHQGKYDAAETKFQRFVDRHAETELADNALFWIGESRYARGNYSSALEAFTATVERFPKGNKVADALLKAGRCLESLGEREQAITTYREVRQRFPGSAAAAKAADQLGQLGGP